MKQFIHKNILLFVVFFTGAAVLVLEVTATRVLSAFFGSTIYTVSSVISVILLALSLGYYIGGRLADKAGTATLFYAIITISGVSVFVLHFLKLLVAPFISQQFSIQDGPLILSMVLFFLPGFLLGTLSPIVVKLQKQHMTKDGVGKVAGDVFFWSTLGSIVGSLATGFYLIPSFGVDQIIAGVGGVLLALGLVGLATCSKDSLTKLKFFLLLPFALLVQFSVLFIQHYLDEPAVIFSKDGVYGSLIIYDGIHNDKPARFFQQDIDSSSAMYLDSSELVYDYTKYYELYTLAHPTISDALVIGAGVYSIPKALLEKDRHVRVDVVDIEPSLIELGREYFQVPSDPRLANYVEDGRRFLYDRDKKYDLIFGDAFHFSIPQHLATKEFFELSKSRLKPEGMYMMNIIGTLANTKPSFVLSELRTFKSVFPNSYFFAVRNPRSDTLQNIVIVGYNSEKKLDLSRAESLPNESLKNAPKNLIAVEELGLEQHPIFTDNYAPVEFYISKNTLDLR